MDIVERAVQVLRRDGIIVYPTETVYGLGGDAFALGFAGRFLPGPVTVILEARSCIPPLLTGGTGRIGIRVPAHDLALRIISSFDSPITATSANISGAQDPVSPGEIRVPYDLLVDGGVLPGTPSTVVDLVDRRILREGTLADEVAGFLREQGGHAG
jgi:L-threonylcarbamoyladenylate synthase